MNNSKNIAIFIDSLGGGGAERVMLNLAKGLVLAGHKPHIFCLESRKDHELPVNIPVHVLYLNKKLKKITGRFNIVASAKKLEGLVGSVVTANGPFNLHLANLDPTNKVVARCSFKNVHYVLHSAMEHEIAREKKLGPLKYWKKLKAKKVMDGKKLVAVSKGVAEEALNLGVIKPKSVTTIYNPCDFELIKNLSKEECVDIPNEPYLIHVGRVVKAKRHDVLFKALARVPNIKMVLLCKDVTKARKVAAKFGVEDRLITPGFTNNPYNWIANSKLMVLSSEYEGLPTVIMESLVCNTPVVATNCNYGPSEILVGDMQQFLVPVGDDVALSNKINETLASLPRVLTSPILEEVTLESAVKKYIALAN